MDLNYQHFTISADESEQLKTKQGHAALPTINSDSVGATQISAMTVVLAPLEVSHIHVHPHESIIYVLSGNAVTFMGEEMQATFQQAGDYLFIPKGVAHLPINLSSHEPLVGIIARANAERVEPVELRPDLDKVAGERIRQLRQDYIDGRLSVEWPPAGYGATSESGLQK